MKPGRLATLLALAATLANSAGCTLLRSDQCFEACNACTEPLRPPCGPTHLEIDEPCPDGCLSRGSQSSLAPDTVPMGAETRYWDLSLEEAIQLAMARSEVLRDLGATVLRAPTAARRPIARQPDERPNDPC